MSSNPVNDGSLTDPMCSDEMKEAVRECYDRLAPYYLCHTRPQAREQYLASFRSLKRESRVLDAGCGTGHDAFCLAQLGLKVTAVDMSAEMCRLSHKRLQGIDDTEVLQADTDKLDEPDGTFDGILSALEIFHHTDL